MLFSWFFFIYIWIAVRLRYEYECSRSDIWIARSYCASYSLLFTYKRCSLYKHIVQVVEHLNIREETFKSSWLKNRNSGIQKIVQSRIRQKTSIEKFSLVVSRWQDEQSSLSEEERRSRRLKIGLSNFSVISYVATPFLRELELNYDIKGNVDLLLPPSPSLLSANWESLSTEGQVWRDEKFGLPLLQIPFYCLKEVRIKKFEGCELYFLKRSRIWKL